ncbi:hypothetical protein K5X82_00815 [Halosquirtibacter xylanolyticus]|uniref:hypothetical protein n=1 Tax=Halosquirtibacter xylanolyticus TaxID=3374599 RepID=UPI00374A11B1|nr:hypothetical protein K5X82_00815 [Prolixibacteraceae bacterium]
MKFILALLFSIFLFSCSSKKHYNDWTKDRLQGEVRSFTEWSYRAKDSADVVVKGIRARPYGYDQQLVYDNNGRCIEQNSYNSDDLLVNRSIMVYDNNGLCVEKQNYSLQEGLMNKSIFTYDTRDNCIAQEDYDAEANLEYRYTYRFDHDNRCVEEKRYTSESHLISKLLMRYDNHGQCVERSYFNADNQLDYKLSFDFNQNGYRSQRISYDLKGDPDSKTVSHYEYDKHGNWTKRIDHMNGRPEYILERTYDYF